MRTLITNGPEISAAGIANAANYVAGKVSPGEIIDAYGANFGPPAVSTMQVVGGYLTTSLSDTSVIFDGTPAPMIYAIAGTSNSVVSCIVPYSVSGTTNVQLQYKGVLSNIVNVPVVAAAPGVFSITQTGVGQGAILNLDYSPNGASNPATAGSVVMVFATGEGSTDIGKDGQIVPMAGPYPAPVLGPWTATVGGVDSPNVWYAGSAGSGDWAVPGQRADSGGAGQRAGGVDHQNRWFLEPERPDAERQVDSELYISTIRDAARHVVHRDRGLFEKRGGGSGLLFGQRFRRAGGVSQLQSLDAFPVAQSVGFARYF